MTERVRVAAVMAAAIGFLISSNALAEEAPAGGDVQAQPAAPAEAPAPAETPTPAEAPTPAPNPDGEAQAAEEERPEQPLAVSEAVVRLGRIEMILIQNEDPESAIEFALQVIEQDGDAARPRMLIAASHMLLQDPGSAMEHYVRAIRLSERNDPETHLHALYGLARALQRAGQLQQAAEAYDHYVTYAQQHPDVTTFTEIAQRLSRVLRARARYSR